jgi:hypothetical protein
MIFMLPGSISQYPFYKINNIMRWKNVIEAKKRKKSKRSNPIYYYGGWGWYPASSEEGGGDVSESVKSDPTADDIRDVAEWFHTTPDNLKIEITKEPITRFTEQIKNMYSSYGKFPKDAERTKKIMREIKKGGKLYPIYISSDDSDEFIMEGRHRAVAFMLLGVRIIPVAWVSRKV